jgi:methylated-DNA-[protein]-cysteine S-methyltransferase
MASFSELVWQATRRIPKGKVATYSVIAKLIKRPKAVRAVGNALNKNPYAPAVPCHRVVRSDGSVGGFASGSGNKIKLLRSEKINIINNKVKPLKDYLFKG